MVTGVGILLVAVFWTNDFEGFVSSHSDRIEVQRDYAGAVVSAQKDDSRVLLVNGIGMTKLSPITKLMVHLPLVLHQSRPESALVICFGMGTTFRSALSWGLDTTAVELVPSVTSAFGFFHPDAANVLSNPKGHIVIDDGRRYLMRTRGRFDVIVIDPPPPPEAAGSSLLYSQEFSELAREHLKPHGILETWFFGSDDLAFRGLLRSLTNTFHSVRVFGSIEGWGTHILASMDPIEVATPEQLIARMPDSAKSDLMEWTPAASAISYLNSVLTRERSIDSNLHSAL